MLDSVTENDSANSAETVDADLDWCHDSVHKDVRISLQIVDKICRFRGDIVAVVVVMLLFCFGRDGGVKRLTPKVETRPIC